MLGWLEDPLQCGYRRFSVGSRVNRCWQWVPVQSQSLGFSVLQIGKGPPRQGSPCSCRAATTPCPTHWRGGVPPVQDALWSVSTSDPAGNTAIQEVLVRKRIQLAEDPGTPGLSNTVMGERSLRGAPAL